MIEDVLRENLLTVARAYAKAKGMTLDAVSYRFYGNGLFLREIQHRKGKGKRGERRSVSLRMLDEMFSRFAREWPEDEPWPMLQTLTIERVDGKISVNRRSKH